MLSQAQVIAMIPCVDMDRARAFYGSTLGLEEIDFDSAAQIDEYPVIGFVCGKNTMLGIYQRPTPTTADHTVANFIVENVAAAVDDLTGRGIKFETYDMPGVEFDERGVASMGDFKSAWFKDPEGNILSVSEMPEMV